MNPFRSVGARLSLALVFVVALALALVYLIVIPSLRQRLIDSKLSQLRDAIPSIATDASQTQSFEFTDQVQVWQSRAEARAIVYSYSAPATEGRTT